MATEFATLKVNEHFSLQAMQKALDFFNPPPKGLQSYRWGRVVTDPNTIIFILNWDSVADHEAFMKAPIYPAFRETISSFLTAPTGISMYHTHFHPFPITEVFEADNVEVASLTKKPEISRGKFKETIIELLGALAEASGYKSHFHGVKHEDGDVYIVLVGWDSVESHALFNASRPDIMAALRANVMLEKSSALDVKMHPH